MCKFFFLNPDLVIEQINKLSCQPLGHGFKSNWFNGHKYFLRRILDFWMEEGMSGSLRTGLRAPPEGGLGGNQTLLIGFGS